MGCRNQKFGRCVTRNKTCRIDRNGTALPTLALAIILQIALPVFYFSLKQTRLQTQYISPAPALGSRKRWNWNDLRKPSQSSHAESSSSTAQGKRKREENETDNESEQETIVNKKEKGEDK